MDGPAWPHVFSHKYKAILCHHRSADVTEMCQFNGGEDTISLHLSGMQQKGERCVPNSIVPYYVIWTTTQGSGTDHPAATPLGYQIQCMCAARITSLNMYATNFLGSGRAYSVNTWMEKSTRRTLKRCQYANIVEVRDLTTDARYVSRELPRSPPVGKKNTPITLKFRTAEAHHEALAILR
jgi:hypothetical protein